MSENRKLYYLIAKPMTDYFLEQGIESIESLPMVAAIAQRVYENLENNVEVTTKPKDQIERSINE